MRGIRTVLMLTAVLGAHSTFQTPTVNVDEARLREYSGVYQWAPNAFVYLQMWNEFSGFSNPAQLVAFDEAFPGTPDHPRWQSIRLLYFYDPTAALKSLRPATLAIFGELDNNIVAEKNKAAWESALRSGGNRDYTLQILAKANHYQWEATIGSNEEMASLQRFVPTYFTTVRDWLATRIRGFRVNR